MTRTYEQGPIRPPSEADSLLLRLTRNCPWNRCAFCSSYKNARFSLRTTEEIIAEIDLIRRIADRLVQLSVTEGEHGTISENIVRLVWNSHPLYDTHDRMMALWLYHGGKSVFLQDADSLVMKTDDVASILRYLRHCFPSIERVTTYCRSHTASRKSPEDLKILKESGLTRIHIGLESGSDTVLKMIDKGATASMHIEAGRRVKGAGIELSEYVIPGLGGVTYPAEHARETARVLNAIDPDFIRLRTLHVTKGTPLWEMMQRGDFIPPDDDSIVSEIREFISLLEGVHSCVASDHILNLLEELQGRLPLAKQDMLSTIDRYLALSDGQRLVFRLGKRRGIYRNLSNLDDPETYHTLKEIVDNLEKQEPGLADKRISSLLNDYI